MTVIPSRGPAVIDRYFLSFRVNLRTPTLYNLRVFIEQIFTFRIFCLYAFKPSNFQGFRSFEAFRSIGRDSELEAWVI